MSLEKDFQDRDLVMALAARLAALVDGPLRVMEVCGTHTMAVYRNGLHGLLPPEMELISGPGCPVCVTSAGDMDAIISLASRPGVLLAVFGDLMRVPGSGGLGTLSHARARGAAVEVVYSAMDALDLARRRPGRTVVFVGIGFETTAPGTAATILAARAQGVDNFCVYSCHKVMPGPLHTLLSAPDQEIDGLLCPGHVSTIIGARAYAPLARDLGLCCVVAGFEAADILDGLARIAIQRREGAARVENAYPRAVTWEGNARAREIMDQVFVPEDSAWRGLGLVSRGGLAISPALERFDARARLETGPRQVPEPPGCRCGVILTGRERPADCPLFGRACTPSTPVGPCMVSSEGACAAHYLYGGDPAR